MYDQRVENYYRRVETLETLSRIGAASICAQNHEPRHDIRRDEHSKGATSTEALAERSDPPSSVPQAVNTPGGPPR